MIIVVGMHRSGTSTVAGLLHQGGVCMGEDRALLPAPSDENPHGFFENHRFRLLNDRIAERRGYRIKSWQPQIPPCRPRLLTRRRMRRLLREYQDRYPFWGFKDPRTCLTLGAWLEEIQRVAGPDAARVVFCARSPGAVAHSLARRDGLDVPTALRLWTLYNERALAALDAWGPPAHYLSYEELCRRPAASATALFRFAGVRPEAAASGEFVDAALDRSSRGAPAVSAADALDEAVRETTRRIECRVRACRGLGASRAGEEPR